MPAPQHRFFFLFFSLHRSGEKKREGFAVLLSD